MCVCICMYIGVYVFVYGRKFLFCKEKLKYLNNIQNTPGEPNLVLEATFFK